jgi:hypothetical protein
LQRILDIDLDFFVDEPTRRRSLDDGRPNPGEHPTMELDDALSYVHDHLGLRGPVPGFVVEHHVELFSHWRRAIASGALVAPFHLAHLDAHADLGLGETGHKYLLTEIMSLPPERRQYPEYGVNKLTDGSFVAFAAACRWLSEIDYVFSPQGGSDLHPYLMEGFDPEAEAIQLAALTPAEFRALRDGEEPDVETDEPRIPVRQAPRGDFHATMPYDFVCIAHSAAYTPPTADPIFDEIRARFIDETAL